MDRLGKKQTEGSRKRVYDERDWVGGRVCRSVEFREESRGLNGRAFDTVLLLVLRERRREGKRKRGGVAFAILPPVPNI